MSPKSWQLLLNHWTQTGLKHYHQVRYTLLHRNDMLPVIEKSLARCTKRATILPFIRKTLGVYQIPASLSYFECDHSLRSLLLCCYGKDSRNVSRPKGQPGRQISFNKHRRTQLLYLEVECTADATLQEIMGFTLP